MRRGLRLGRLLLHLRCERWGSRRETRGRLKGALAWQLLSKARRRPEGSRLRPHRGLPGPRRRLLLLLLIPRLLETQVLHLVGQIGDLVEVLSGLRNRRLLRRLREALRRVALQRPLCLGRRLVLLAVAGGEPEGLLLEGLLVRLMVSGQRGVRGRAEARGRLRAAGPRGRHPVHWHRRVRRGLRVVLRLVHRGSGQWGSRAVGRGEGVARGPGAGH